MVKSELFAEILSAVVRESEVSGDRILSRARDEETVDARYVLVYLLWRRGFYPRQIAEMIGRSKRSVNHILATFEGRVNCGHLFGINVEIIGKQSGNK